MESLWYVFLAILGLGFLIFIHELGHYWAARKRGMTVEVFSIGLGAPMKSWIWQGVRWQIGWLPFGGFVKIPEMEGPEESEDGIRARSKPWDRILVAFAGPAVNLIFAFLIFCCIWGMGGREKSFSYYTSYIGWVDPQSELYAQGLRPGDQITGYDGYAYQNAGSHIIGPSISGDEVSVSGFFIDHKTGKEKAFDLEVPTYSHPTLLTSDGDKVKTAGVLAPAGYLIFQESLPTFSPENGKIAPILESGIQEGDRIVWADGKLVFSSTQLSEIINDGRMLLTVRRGNETFLKRVPRLPLYEFRLDREQREEIKDWEFSQGLSEELNQTFFVPYSLSPQGVVEGRLTFVDAEAEREAFPSYYDQDSLESPLQKGDQILGVSGEPISHVSELLKAAQVPGVRLIVARQGGNPVLKPWKEADLEFDENIEWRSIESLSQSLVALQPAQSSGDMVLLSKVEPQPKSLFTPKQLLQEQKKEILKGRDSSQSEAQLEALDKDLKTLLIGGRFQQNLVIYNPPPWTLMGDTLKETWRTLSALFGGSLPPKYLAGPVGIVQVFQRSWGVGISEALFWMALISFNLGIINLFPIPVLDGGRILLDVWEIVTKKPLKGKTLERIIVPFVFLLVGFMIFLTYHDLMRLFQRFF